MEFAPWVAEEKLIGVVCRDAKMETVGLEASAAWSGAEAQAQHKVSISKQPPLTLQLPQPHMEEEVDKEMPALTLLRVTRSLEPPLLPFWFSLS